MPSISFVVARSEPGHVIGCENKLPWRLRTDMRNFKAITTNHVVIMGRKTFDSIGRALPNRINIVISRRQFTDAPDVHVANGREAALHLADFFSIKGQLGDIFVVGGGAVYSEFEELFNKIYLTEVHAKDIEGDAFFEYNFDRRSWKLMNETKYPASEFDEYPFTISVFEKKNKKKRFRPLSKFMKPDEQLNSWRSGSLNALRAKKK